MGSVREFPMHFPLLISSQSNVFFCQSFLLLFVVSTILTAGHIFSLMSIMSAIKVRSTRKKQKTWEEGKKLESNFRKYKRWGNVTSLVAAAAGNALLIGWAVKQERSLWQIIWEAVCLFSCGLYTRTRTIRERTVEPDEFLQQPQLAMSWSIHQLKDNGCFHQPRRLAERWHKGTFWLQLRGPRLDD